MGDQINEVECIISKHAQQRYAERIIGKEESYDVKYFVINNKEKIIKDINKMINYGEIIYSGRQLSVCKGDVIDAYLNGLWIILVDNKSKIVVTLFKIDLGLGDEFNKMYLDKMMILLNERKHRLEDVEQEVQEESDTCREIIESVKSQIKEYRSMIKNLEELCDGYKTIIKNNHVRVSQAEKEVADVLDALCGKRQ